MIIKNIEKKDNLALCEKLSKKLIKYPMFMHFCPNIEDREKFIKAFLYYYIFEWSEYDTLLTDENQTVLATMIDPHSFEYKFKGKGAIALKRMKNSKSIFAHRETVKGIVHIVAPGTMNPRVFNIYGISDSDIEAVDKIVDEAIEISNENGYTLVYETFSQKLIPFMQSKGFALSYQKQFMDTRFIETLMTYTPPRKPKQIEEID